MIITALDDRLFRDGATIPQWMLFDILSIARTKFVAVPRHANAIGQECALKRRASAQQHGDRSAYRSQRSMRLKEANLLTRSPCDRHQTQLSETQAASS
jgi:hypothetical protein